MDLAAIYLLVTIGAAASASLLIAGSYWLWPSPQRERGVSLDHLAEPRSFCFRDGYLVSTERNTGFLLPHPINRLTAWDDLRDALAGLIPGAAPAMDVLQRTGEAFRLEGRMGRDRLHLIGIRDGQELRVTLAAADDTLDTMRMDVATLAALEAESVLLARSHATGTHLAWVLDEAGRVIWGNGPYVEEVIRRLGPDAAAVWPIPELFHDEGEPPHGPTRRCLAQREGEEARGIADAWYEVVVHKAQGGLRHAHAQPLDRVIEAEESLRRFIRTLTNTFTALPTGLAIFDADRNLVMFNPPLLDMTGLDGAFLAGRPHLTDVLDALREKQRLPEPRDWRSWRDALVATGTGETHGEWRETWTLATGQSFRMTARPQPDGAVAILLEEITAELTLARRRRSDGDALAALLDASEEAVASFGGDGAPLHLNVHMRELGGFDIEAPPQLEEFLSRWATLCAPTPLWGEIRDLGRSHEPRADWVETVRLLDGGEEIDIQVLPLTEGRVALRATGDLAAVHGLQRRIEAVRGKAAALTIAARGEPRTADAV